MKTRLVFLFLVQFLSFKTYSQVLLDSLRLQLSACKTDTCKARIQNAMVAELSINNNSEYSALVEKLFLSIPQTDSINYLNAQFNYAYYCITNNQPNKAFTILSALKIIGLKTNNVHYLAKSNFGLAIYNRDNNDLKTSTDLFF